MGCVNSKGGKATSKDEEFNLIGNLMTFDQRLHKEWNVANRKGKDQLRFKDIKFLCHKLNQRIPLYELKTRFELFDKNRDGVLSFDEFEKLFLDAQSLPDLSDIFKQSCIPGESTISAKQLQSLILLTIGTETKPSITDCTRLILLHEGIPMDEADDWIRKNDIEESTETELQMARLTYHGFQGIITDPNFNNLVNNHKTRTVYQDMTRPLSEYFISSSHNTYLSGNQLKSDCSPKAVSRALNLGVRVIELDVWNGPDLSTGPMVNHGHTLCTPTTFEACLQAVKEDCFKASEYPVILTIENHCSLPFQEAQVILIETILGDLVYHWPGRIGKNGDIDWSLGPQEWASPQELKGKIVIRDKPIKKVKKMKSSLAKNNTATKPTEDIIYPEEEFTPELENLVIRNVHEISEKTAEDDQNSDENLGVDPRLLRIMYIKNVKLSKIVQKDKSIVAYSQPEFYCSSSISEGKMIKLTKPGFFAHYLAQYAQNHIVRVYPNGSRTGSSNYDPTTAWNAGCQMIALNYQTKSLPVWLNQGKFSDNGGCGYILKPEILQKGEKGEAWYATPTEVVCELTITVLSCHYLPKPLGKSNKSEVIDPYIEISIHGVEEDAAKVSTRIIPNNGFNPTWNETFTFELRAPELSLMSFVVRDSDIGKKDDLIAQRVVPIPAIITGYKIMPLLLSNSKPSHSYLFCKVELLYTNSPKSST